VSKDHDPELAECAECIYLPESKLRGTDEAGSEYKPINPVIAIHAKIQQKKRDRVKRGKDER
jgi:hypothetical protein